MIANAREYEITKEEIERFATALEEADRTNPNRDSEMQALLKAALASQLADLRAELAEYERRTAAAQLQLVEWAATAVSEQVRLLQDRVESRGYPMVLVAQRGTGTCTSTSRSSVTMLTPTAR